jgi:hypothetical protein
MKKFSWIIFLSLIFLSISQNYADYTETKTKVCAYDGPAGGGYAFNYYLQDIGLYSNVNGLKYTNRAKYSFDLSNIPTNAYISNVSISVTCSNNNSLYKYKITQLASNWTEPYDIYIQIPTSSVLYSDVSNQTNGTLSPNNSLYNLVNNNRGGHIYLGVYSENEVDGANSDVNISLHVDVNMVSLIADNNFNIAPANDGAIYVESIQKTAPYNFQKQIGQTTTLTAQSPQTDGQNYQRVWSTGAPVFNSKWREYNAGGDITLNNTITNISYTTVSLTNNDDRSTFEAGLRKVCNINFQNNFTNGGHGGTIIVNGTQYNSPATGFGVIEQNPITGTSQNQSITGIDYTFKNWSDGSTQNQKTFYPSIHTTYSAIFKGKPNVVSRNLHYNASNPNQPITVIWSEHPSSDVTK